MKPTEFAEVKHWYHATLESLEDSKNYNNNNTSNSKSQKSSSSKLVLHHVYNTVFHGFSARLSTRQAQQLEEQPGVVAVFPDRVYNLHTTRTPYFLGLYGDTYNTIARPLLNESNFGSNVIIGFLDAGIDPNHPSFNDDGLEPLPAAKRWKGKCAVKGFQCNNKLVGVRYLTPGKNIGHGTQTASTAAGRALKNVFYSENGESTAVGVAPKARIALYKVCNVATMDICSVELGIEPAPVVASFSSRGPNPSSPYVMKPDVLAPGVNILAAWPGDVDFKLLEFNFMSGTSMACAHVSGLAALLKGAHPKWSATMIRSAIMTTAYTTANDGKPILNNDGTKSTTSDMGAGHIDTNKALDPGLVYDITPQDYTVAFMCASKYTDCSARPWDLNYPAISIDLQSLLHNDITIKRTVTNVGEADASYAVKVTNPRGVNLTINPTTMSFTSKDEKQNYSVTITATDLPKHITTVEGKIVWSDGKRRVVSPVVIVNTHN
ncbi:Subtilase family protein [Striga hermonthica]|uniref:Subtilase family protein n=1 Tax=Striga hermonthica TaxID=68872 RepID=A0A9N7NEZ6_STRHE|nr:Subtilase family protein [Striga hermonthica]